MPEAPPSAFTYYALKLVVIIIVAFVVYLVAEIVFLFGSSLFTNKYAVSVKAKLPLGTINLMPHECDRYAKSIAPILERIIGYNSKRNTHYSYSNPIIINSAVVLSSEREYGLVKYIPSKGIKDNIYSIVNYVNDLLNCPYCMVIETDKVSISKLHTGDNNSSTVSIGSNDDSSPVIAYLHCILKHHCPEMFAETTPAQFNKFMHGISNRIGLSSISTDAALFDDLFLGDQEISKAIEYALSAMHMEDLISDNNHEMHSAYLLYRKMRRSAYSETDVNFQKLTDYFADYMKWLANDSTKAEHYQFGEVVVVHAPYPSPADPKKSEVRTFDTCLSYIQGSKLKKYVNYAVTSTDGITLSCSILRKHADDKSHPRYDSAVNVLNATKISSRNQVPFKSAHYGYNFFMLNVLQVPHYAKMSNEVVYLDRKMKINISDTLSSYKVGDRVLIVNNGAVVASAKIVIDVMDRQLFETKIDEFTRRNTWEYMALRDESNPSFLYGFYEIQIEEVYANKVVTCGAPVVSITGDLIGVIPCTGIGSLQPKVEQSQFYLLLPHANSLINFYESKLQRK